ncbi:MAG TPA: ergothioneine biosynthesis protein EgtB [Puia sp.]|nr:ergothioneine biosynthesis protein EgtB [Puia sp.]
MSLLEQYRSIRKASEDICRPLQKEDYVVQPVADVSPPKWHLGHTTWFWETFLLEKQLPGYKVFNPDYNFVFNSYYETIGARVIRTDRGNLSRPSVEEVYQYRQYVDNAMEKLLSREPPASLRDIILLGLNHEQQHQELLWSDIKYILGHNPLFPAWSGFDINDPGKAAGDLSPVPPSAAASATSATPPGSTLPGAMKSGAAIPGKRDEVTENLIPVPAGIYEIGYNGDGFCFDNEEGRHKVWLDDFKIAGSLVTNEEYSSFIRAGGYENFIYWHAEGWDWVKKNHIGAPLYWHWIEGKWFHYTLAGLRPLAMEEPVCHISYYEAVAYAAWKGMRLPTESEWEAASGKFNWGKRWEWTESAYLPYPGFKKAEGAIGEYNGKFMVSQMVLRGASVATPALHSRHTYRNFFHPHLRWQFTGIRLAGQ